MLSNEAFILSAPLSAYFEELPIPELRGDEVLIDVKQTGICGSDVHLYTKGTVGADLMTEPIVGTLFGTPVSERPDFDLNVRYSDTSLPESFQKSVPASVRKGLVNGWQLSLGQFAGSANSANLADIIDLIPPKRGTLCRYFKVPGDIAYTLPDDLSLEDGAMMEPLACAVHAVRYLGKLSAGQSVVIFGCGPVGLLCMAVARALGSTRIIAVDKVAQRLDFAKEYAATDSFTPPEPTPSETIKDYSARSSILFRQMVGLQEDGSGIDVVIEASGAQVCLQTGLLVAKNGATFVQVGLGLTDVQFPLNVVMSKELTIKGSLRYGPGDYPAAISLASSGKVNLKPLVTHRFEFADAIAALEAAKSGKDANGNVVLKTMISGPSNEVIDRIVNKR